MPDDLYEDALAWSEQQADLLRRLVAGERVNAELDWPNIIEEIQDVGLSELHAVQSLLARALEHLLKAYGWPDGSVAHWKREIRAFLSDASRRVSPSMRLRLGLPDLYERARLLVAADDLDGHPPRPLPETCPFTVEDLFVTGKAPPDVDALLAKLAASP
ncbi:MAG: DUF29 domain-containing protein [Acetobacteraceae bacterium]|nr:DUF29 domain-containing protein [Acetobacteraceae bacterium]